MASKIGEIKQSKFTYSTLTKSFEKQTKAIKDQTKKIDTIKDQRYMDEDEDIDHDVREDEVKMKPRLDKHKLLSLQGKNNEYLDLGRGVNHLINLKVISYKVNMNIEI